MTYPAAFGPYHGAYELAIRQVQERCPTWVIPMYGDMRALDRYKILQRIVKRNRPYFLDTPMHPAVKVALTKLGHPKDWHLLVLEEPAVSLDGKRVAYVRNDQKRVQQYNATEANKFLTVTTIGKYLTRHWPDAESTAIRDIAAMFSSEYVMLDNMESMVDAILRTKADSCMVFTQDEVERIGAHPYEVYDPAYGWKMAIAKDDNGKVTGRALVYENGCTKGFVRTYGLDISDGSTQAHQGLHAWLQDQGYDYWDEWPEGCKFKKIPHKGDADYVAPYLDPGSARIATSNSRRVRDSGKYFIRDDEGEWDWDNTDGTPTLLEDDRTICDRCGDRVDDEDMVYIGYHSDECVCSECIRNDYVAAIGRRGHEYYIRDSQAIQTIDGDYYDSDYLSSNDIVELHDGRYCKHDDAIWVESESEYYHVDEEDSSEDSTAEIVYAEDEYALRTDAQWCVYRQEWIQEENATEVANGKYVHSDDLDEYLMELPLEELEANCVDCDYEEKLEMWNEHHGIEPAEPTVEIPEPVIA